MKSPFSKWLMLTVGILGMRSMNMSLAYEECQTDNGQSQLCKVSSLTEITNPFAEKCAHITSGEVYNGRYYVYVDAFKNGSNRDLYLFENRFEVEHNGYLTFNNTKYPGKTTKLIHFDYPVLAGLNWKIAPGQTITHLTTAEKIGSPAEFEYKDWPKMLSPKNFNGFDYTQPNYRVISHPKNPTYLPNFDYEFRTLTLYSSSDEKPSGSEEDKAIIECVKDAIRRCGDGILSDGQHPIDEFNGVTDFGEQCDPNDPTQTNRGTAGCDPERCVPVNLEFSKIVAENSNPAANPGETISWVLTLTGHGPEKAKNYKIYDYAPAGFVIASAKSERASDSCIVLLENKMVVCTLPEIDNGETVHIYVDMVAENLAYKQSMKSCNFSIFNTGYAVRSGETAADPSSLTATASIPFERGYLEVQKTLREGSEGKGISSFTNIGDELIWRVQVTVHGTIGDAIKMQELLPPELEFVELVKMQETTSIYGTPRDCAFGAVPGSEYISRQGTNREKCMGYTKVSTNANDDQIVFRFNADKDWIFGGDSTFVDGDSFSFFVKSKVKSLTNPTLVNTTTAIDIVNYPANENIECGRGTGFAEAHYLDKYREIDVVKEAETDHYSKVGDEISWLITATIHGENVTGFTIEDQIPDELVLIDPEFEVVTPPTVSNAKVMLTSVGTAKQSANTNSNNNAESNDNAGNNGTTNNDQRPYDPNVQYNPALDDVDRQVDRRGVEMNNNGSSSNNTKERALYFDVETKDGNAFQSGDVVKIRIFTKVDKLPNPLDKIQNIACVDPGTPTQNCDDAIVLPKIGKVSIVKDAEKDHYSKVGDEISWLITATVNGEGITGFTIEDQVPVELVLIDPEFEVVTPPTVSNAKVMLTSVGTAKQSANTNSNNNAESNDNAGNNGTTNNDQRPYDPNVQYNPALDDVDRQVDRRGVEMNNNGSSSNNTKERALYFDVETKDGNAFQSGDVIQIRIFTKVDKLPDPLDKIRNVVCVNPGTQSEVCDKEPVDPLVGKALISKIAEQKTFTNLGDTVTWRIIITGNNTAEGFGIKDFIPAELVYTGFEIIRKPDNINVVEIDYGNSKVSGRTDSGVVFWDVQGELNNDVIEMRIFTVVDRWDANKKEARNVVCVDGSDICDDDIIQKEAGDLYCRKTFTDGSVEKEVKIGEEIGYRIEFWNDGTVDMTGSIRDYFPKNLEFVSAEWVYDRFEELGGVPTYTRDNIMIPAHTSGYLLLTGKVTSGWRDITLNLAKIHFSGSVAIQPEQPRARTCENTPVYTILFDKMLGFDKEMKPGAKNTIASGEVTTFQLRIQNLGISPMTGFTVTDTLPEGLEFVDNVAGHELFAFSQNGNVLTWAEYQGVLNPGETVYIDFEVRGILVSPTEDDWENRACLTHPDFPERQPTTNAYTAEKNCYPEVVTVIEPNEVLCNPVYDGRTLTGTFNPPEDPTADQLCIPSGNPATNIQSSTTGRTWICGEGENAVQCSALKEQTGNLIITKEIEGNGSTGYAPGDIVTFRLSVTNRGDKAMTNFTVTDTLPAGLSFEGVRSRDGFTAATVQGAKIVRTYTETLEVGETAVIIFEAKIDDNVLDNKDEATLVNRVCLTHPDFPTWTDSSNSRENCDDAEVKINEIMEIGYCGDGKAEAREDCDCGDGLSGSKVCDLSKADIASRVPGGVNGGICRNCKIETQEPIKPIACFNVNNGSISLNKGEILPYFRNIEKAGDDHYVNDRNAREGASCDTVGDIALNAMTCEFAIYNGTRNSQLSGNPYRESGKVPCFAEEETIYVPSLISNLREEKINQNLRSFDIRSDKEYTHRAKFRSNLEWITNFGNNPNTDILGEYKIVLERVNYLQCIPEDPEDPQNDAKVWTQMDPYPRVCEVDFTLTDHYILQKTPAGNITASSTELDKYYNIDGVQLFGRNEGILKDILSVGNADYKATAQVSNALTKFIDNYSKLAIKVNAPSNFATSVEVRKVPGKEIYFVDGDLTLTTTVAAKPFTIVQTRGNTTIKGNVENNMMLLTKGTIIFDGSETCDNPQIIRGILYANKFESTNGKINDNERDSERCIGGNIHIKGVVIEETAGSLEQVSDARRSNLNRWFSTFPEEISKRQDLVMNGASLLIEYAPSVFGAGTMPPGAEDFTTALDVYRDHGAAPVVLSLLGGLIKIVVNI